MAEDWKDMLSALRGNLQEPEEDEANTLTEEKKETVKKGKLTVVTDKKGRNGKIATIVEGFTISDEEVAEIARELKKKLGVGGSSRGGEILIQGDHKKSVSEYLSQHGFKVS